MRARLSKLFTAILVAVITVATLAPLAEAADATAPVVINEVYGGGGNAGATLQHDFIELFNKSTSSVDLSTWSVQYASATGTTWTVTALAGTLPANTSYVVRQAAGANTSAAPVTGDVSGTANMSGTAGKVALVNSTIALTCGATQGSCSSLASVIDFVGYGTTASDHLGSARAPAPSNATSVTRDASHTNTANNGTDFTTAAPSPVTCGSACTAPPPPPPVAKTIVEIQGTGASSPLVGQAVTTRGIVTAAYPTGGLQGYYLQTPGTGGPTDPATRASSDGLFVYQPSAPLPAAVSIGNYLEVTGTVSEFFGLTQVTVNAADVVDLAESPTAVSATTTSTWPTTEAQRETLEGMLYRPTGSFTVTNTFSTNQFGEVGLAFGTTPLLQRTEVELPGPSGGSAVEADNAARRVVLDDGSSVNFLATSGGNLVNGNLTPPYISSTAPVRVGAPVTFVGDVIVDYRFNLWRFQPPSTVVGPTNAGSPATFANTRTPAPDKTFIGTADLEVASFNVLNFFTTLGTDDAACQAFRDRDGGGSTVSGGCDQRGAWDSGDFARQQIKIVEAINALDAEVVGLMEIENSAALGEPVDEALDALVAALNADAGTTLWAANPSSSELPDPSGQDVITNAIIYKPAAVSRVGASRALGAEGDAGEAFQNAREPIGQVFAPAGGGDPFLFVVNHFKSKGSAGPWPGDTDAGDGQGASNESRERQATALRDWVPTVLPAGTKGVVLAGDFNSYTREDPLRILYEAGYTNAETAFAHNEHSYSFSGLSGSLDHILLNDVALGRATGTDIWNINAGESLALEYSRWNYHATDFHQPDPYRSSDHDPVIVGLRAQSSAVPVQVLGTNDFHGRIQASGAEAGAAVLAGAVKQLRAAQPNTVFAAAGDLIGASTFESFIAKDKPTIDALNAAGLEVSAVGNHEFDQGYDDLVNRVMADYDATTNPNGGALWEYLGANVRKKSDHSAALPETWTRDFGGIRVGFVGAVTEHLPELVSPAGISTIELESIVTATNRSADQLKSAGADVVVLLVHEGAATTSYESATDPASDFGKIVRGVNDNVDAIVSGHTHLAYNHAVPVPGWVAAGRPVTTRPVVSAGQYGTNLNQLLFQVDPETEKVVVLAHQVLPLVKSPAYPTDAATKVIVDQAVANAAVLGAQPLGKVTGPFNRAKLANGTTENRGAESTLGNLVAEVQQHETAAPESGSAQIAFMNPGGLRTDMVANPGGYPADLTYRQAANVQPFANTLVNMTMTGAQIKAALEQQWQPSGAQRPMLRLGISEGFTYTYDPSAGQGARITGMTLHGTPVTDAATYSVTVNSFLAAGGDNFGAFALGTNKRDTGKVDLQAMVDYLAEKGTVSPDFTQRSVGVQWPSGSSASIKPGDTVAFTLSSLAFTTAADRKDSAVRVALAGVDVGTFPVDNTIGTSVFDEYGTSDVSFLVPVGTSAGAQTLTITGVDTGTVARIPLTIAVSPAPTPTPAPAPEPAPVATPPAPTGSPTPDTGLRLIGADGGVFTVGTDEFLGSAGGLVLNQPIVGSAETPSGNGYWLVASDGGVFTFGDAGFFGSTGDLALNRPIVGISPSPSGRGYWLVASDGGIFAFGDAPFFGSTGDLVLNQPIEAMAPTASGRGYWLVASDGGIFAFGDAPFYGSTGDQVLNQPIVGMAAMPTGAGYWLVASDGGVFAFGRAGFFGSTGDVRLNRPIVALTSSPTGSGYRLVASDGGVFVFGDATFPGSVGGLDLNQPIVGIAD